MKNLKALTLIMGAALAISLVSCSDSKKAETTTGNTAETTTGNTTATAQNNLDTYIDVKDTIVEGTISEEDRQKAYKVISDFIKTGFDFDYTTGSFDTLKRELDYCDDGVKRDVTDEDIKKEVDEYIETQTIRKSDSIVINKIAATETGIFVYSNINFHFEKNTLPEYNGKSFTMSLNVEINKDWKINYFKTGGYESR